MDLWIFWAPAHALDGLWSVVGVGAKLSRSGTPWTGPLRMRDVMSVGAPTGGGAYSVRLQEIGQLGPLWLGGGSAEAIAPASELHHRFLW